MHFLCHLLLLAALSRLVSAQTGKSSSLVVAIWEHEGRETSTLITIHLRLMCAAGGWWFPLLNPRSPLVSNGRQRSRFRWPVGLITLRPGRSSTIDFPWPSFWHGLGKASLGSIGRFDAARGAALQMAGGDYIRLSRVVSSLTYTDTVKKKLKKNSLEVNNKTPSHRQYGKPGGPSDLQSRLLPRSRPSTAGRSS